MQLKQYSSKVPLVHMFQEKAFEVVVLCSVHVYPLVLIASLGWRNQSWKLKREKQEKEVKGNAGV
uniref:Uncharacterized protein n=1 Tax=Setaria italica TaxID=4555 RepID=K4AHS0_SETIT